MSVDVETDVPVAVAGLRRPGLKGCQVVVDGLPLIDDKVDFLPGLEVKIAGLDARVGRQRIAVF